MSTGHEEEMRPVPVAKIHPSPYQPRKVFDEAAIAELAASMRESSLLQPIVVRPKDGEFELIAGERRLRAAQLLKWPQIPAIVRPLSNQQAALLSAIENLQRADLSPVEEAEALQRLMTEHKLTQVQLALKTGIPRSTIQSRLALLAIGPWLELLRAGEITVSQAVAVQRFKTKTEAEHVEAIARMQKAATQRERPLVDMAVVEFTSALEWRFRELEYEQEEANRPEGVETDDDVWDEDEEDGQDAEAKGPSRPRTDWEAKQREQREEAEQKEAVRRAQLAEIVRRAPAAWDGAWWRAAIGWMLGAGFHYQAERQTCVLLGLPDPDEVEGDEIGREEPPSPIVAYAATLPDAELPRLAITLLLAGDVYVNPWSREDATPEKFVAAAQLLGMSLEELVKPDAAPKAKTGNKWERRNKRGSAKHAVAEA